MIKRAFLILLIAGAARTVAFGACPPEGDSRNALQKLLNPLKNRSTIPAPSDFNYNASALEMWLEPGEDSTRFLNSNAATITGFVVKEKLGGVESCNCHSSDPNFMDRHIYIGKTKHASLKDCVIVEVTPRFYSAHQEWKDIAKLPGHEVRFTGWMFFDAEHKQNAVNSNPGGSHIWRATCWEIHPVTAISILK